MTHDTDSKTCACEACHCLRHPEVVATLASLTAELIEIRRKWFIAYDALNDAVAERDREKVRAEAAEQSLRALRDAVLAMLSKGHRDDVTCLLHICISEEWYEANFARVLELAAAPKGTE